MAHSLHHSEDGVALVEGVQLQIKDWRDACDGARANNPPVHDGSTNRATQRNGPVRWGCVLAWGQMFIKKNICNALAYPRVGSRSNIHTCLFSVKSSFACAVLNIRVWVWRTIFACSLQPRLPARERVWCAQAHHDHHSYLSRICSPSNRAPLPQSCAPVARCHLRACWGSGFIVQSKHMHTYIRVFLSLYIIGCNEDLEKNTSINSP